MKNPHIASAKRFPADPAVARAGMEDVTFHDMPFDRLVHDSVRALELFDFEYAFEMYKPAAQRRSGYFALPILLEDRLVGKLDAAADRAVDGPPDGRTQSSQGRGHARDEGEPLRPTAGDSRQASRGPPRRRRE